jgi:hypothetical protein
MKKLIGTVRVLLGVVLLAACAESPTEPAEPEAEWVYEGKWGTRGSGNGEFVWPNDVFVLPSGERAYVADGLNDRVQYFRRSDPAVSPTPLGRVKALFR